MKKQTPEEFDPRPIFDIKLVPLSNHFKSLRAMKIAAFKSALPDLVIAGTYLYTIIMFLDISPEFKSNMQGLIIIELIILLMFPVMFKVFATKEKTEFRANRKLKFMTSWINIFNILFVLAIMTELAFLTSIAEGRKWIPLQLFLLVIIKIYMVFFSGDKKVTPLFFVSRMTGRLVGGLFFGIFTYFIAVISVGLLLNPAMLSEICMLLVGYVFFAMMGIYSLLRQNFLSILSAPRKKNDNQEEIYEIFYPRMEVPLDKYNCDTENLKIKEATLLAIKSTCGPACGINQEKELGTEKPKRKKKRSYVFRILFGILLLPAICLLPMRSKQIEHSKLNRSKINTNKVVWEERFNLGAGIVFGTCMLWILLVVTMMLIREGAVKTQKRL